jgi:hypothetical protein
MAKVVPGSDCFNSAMSAAGDSIDTSEVLEGMQRIQDYKEQLIRSGNSTGLADKLRAFAEKEAERTRIAAAMQRRHAALNVIVRDRLERSVESFMKAGMNPRQAILAILEGTSKGVEGARSSVAAMNLAYEARYLGGMMKEIMAERPHLAVALRDPKLDADVMREMSELREGGKPGITGNDDAKYVAKIFSTYAELARTDLNKLGASIGKLDGWAGPQAHDDVKMIAAGKDAWVDYLMGGKLDIERTFPDMLEAERRQVLGDIYDTITTGLPNRPKSVTGGPQRANPANLAKSLGASRVLHFASPEAALAYRQEFGYGNTVSGIVSHLRNSSRMAANMEVLGPNPEQMIDSLTESVARKIRDASTSEAERLARIAEYDRQVSAVEAEPGLEKRDHDRLIARATRRRDQIAAAPIMSATEKQRLLNTIGLEGGRVTGQIRQALDIATGLASRPVSDGVTIAKIGNDIRAVQSMAKLGGSVISSFSDVAINSAASVFRGSSFFKTLTAQLDALRKGRPKGEVAEVSFLLGEGFDGLLGHIVAPAAAQDGPVGKLAELQNLFFKFNGQSWWTDVTRASAGRIISAEMGMRAKTSFGRLPANYRHVLELHGIDADRWSVIQKAGTRTVEGKSYITPDLIRQLDDDTIAPLVQSRIDAEIRRSEARAEKGIEDPGLDDRISDIIDGARRDLELNVLRFFADETSYGIIETDARTRRFTTRALRPGTAGGEAIRFVAQFKGFPVAFTQRVLGRALFGHRKDATFLERFGHIGSILAGATMAGYMSMTAKDMMRGYWPPRDPGDAKTLMAAFLQGGAAGLYGDFLFSQVNRFGGGVLETIAGPTLGSVADGIDTALKARDAAVGQLTGQEAKAPAADALNLALNNTPFINLFYTRPVLDYLFINSLRDAASPGYLKRQKETRMKEYGQTRLDPLQLGPTAFGR